MSLSLAPLPGTAAARDLQPRRAPAIALAAALCAYVAVLAAPQLLNDADTYWHLAAGDWMFAHRAVPTRDPFTFSFAGRPWDAHEWLSELLMAGAFRAGGWTGLEILFAAAGALAAGVLGWHVARHAARLPACLMLLVAASCLSPVLLARPHLLALPPLVIWTAGLLAARRRSGAPSPWLLALMLVWANLHASFIFGLALIGPFALEAVAASWREPPPAWRGAAIGWTAFGCAAVAVALATPQGLHGLVFPLQVMRMRQLAAINEFAPASMAGTPPIEIALMAFLYATLSRGVRLPRLRLLLLMALLHLAFAHARMELQLAAVAPLILADPLTGAFAQRADAPADAAPSRGRAQWPPGWIALALALALAASGLRALLAVRRADDGVSPIAALAHVPPALRARPVFNDYGFGGYLIFAGVRPLIDGRADMFGDDFLDAYGTATEDKTAFEAMVRRYGIGWAILRAGSATAAMVETLPGWHRLYGDGIAVVEAGPLP